MAKKLAGLGVALVLLAQLEPAAGGVKFGEEDLKSDESLWNLYERWGVRYNVARDPAEKLRRFAVFKDTVRRVHLRAAAGVSPGLNGFADITANEFTRDFSCRMTRRNLTAPPPVKRRADRTLSLPLSVDWRSKTCKSGQPCLGPIRSQGATCGSCWAFAATGALEIHQAIKGENNREPLQLSVQELIDCDPDSNGCDGGFAESAFVYVSRKGISSAAAYPYTAAADGICQASSTPRVDLLMRGYQTVPPNDELQLLRAVTNGPVVISIAVGDNNKEFQDYQGGLYHGEGKECGTDNDHEMLLVGYGVDYYIINNSYGERWGDHGYMLLKRDFGKSPDGTCGILKEGGYYPEIGL